MDAVSNPVTLNKSKLPDVDTSQPDTFETPDVSTDSVNPQNTDILQDKPSEDIDNTNVVVSDAFKKFADKKLDPSTEDYSSSVIRRRRIKKGGFVENQTEYEMAAVDSKDETPLQRFHRLQYEVKKLVQDLQEVFCPRALLINKVKPQETVVPNTIGATQMAEELHILQNNLSSLLTDEKLQPVLNPRYEIEQSAKLQEGLTKKLFSELNNFAAKTEKESSQAVATSAAKPGVVTYELYYTPSTGKQMQQAQLVDLEKRLASLEQIIGLNKNVVPSAKSLVEAVEQLREKLNLLTPPHIENVQKSVVSVAKDVDALIEKQKQVQPQANVEKKVNEIFELVTKWDTVSEQLPAIVLRLKALKNLHEESASFAKNIKDLESQQEEMKRLLKSDAELLKTVEDNFKSNLGVIQTNITTLETRFAEVVKKLEAKK